MLAVVRERRRDDGLLARVPFLRRIGERGGTQRREEILSVTRRMPRDVISSSPPRPFVQMRKSFGFASFAHTTTTSPSISWLARGSATRTPRGGSGLR